MPQLPTELLNQIGVVLEMIVAGVTALLVAFWIGLALWTLRDIRARTRDFFAWLLALLLVLTAGPIGLLLYFLLRPRETLAQVYDRQLEEEALLRDIATRRACPSCQTVTEADWLVCPRCRKELRRRCSVCERSLELDWMICPYCTSPVKDTTAVGAAILPPDAGRASDDGREPQTLVAQQPYAPAPETELVTSTTE
jgi:RNA polymerase subunit RPABC4/transcription elongation factor Spt4